MASTQQQSTNKAPIPVHKDEITDMKKMVDVFAKGSFFIATLSAGFGFSCRNMPVAGSLALFTGLFCGGTIALFGMDFLTAKGNLINFLGENRSSNRKEILEIAFNGTILLETFNNFISMGRSDL